MPPKPGKKGSAQKRSASAGGAAGNKNWEAGLTKAPFEEDSWQACVCLVVGRSPVEEELLQAVALATPQRKLFTSLTRDSVYTKVCELGNPKGKKSDEPPMFNEVMEAAKALLDAGQEIPPDLMAKILKFLLLQIKADDQQRREAEQEEKADAVCSSDRDRSGAKGSDKRRKGPASPAAPSREKKTKLKRREDVEPPTFKDDEPDDGPQHYVVLLGFCQPQLMELLDAVGVHVANVIELCSEQIQTFEGQQEEEGSESNEQRPEGSAALDAEDKQQDSEELAVQARSLDLFWSLLRPMLDGAPPDSKLHDVVQLSYTVSDARLPFHTQDPEALLVLGSSIFDGVASLIYDSLRWRRQYQHYQSHIRLINVPTVVRMDSQPVEVVPSPSPRFKKKFVRDESLLDEEVKLPVLSVKVDKCYYSNLLDLVPPEACSVPLILHCMLEQVVISTEQSLPSRSLLAEDPKDLQGPGLDQQLVSSMLQSFLPLIHTEEERSRLLDNLLSAVQKEEDKKLNTRTIKDLMRVTSVTPHTAEQLQFKSKPVYSQQRVLLARQTKQSLLEKFEAKTPRKKCEQPLIIRHHDERALRLRDIHVVQGFDPAEVEVSLMRLCPVWQLIQSVAQQRNSSSCWRPLKQQLQHYCTDDSVSWPEVERLLHQSVFEAMPLTTLHQGDLLPDAVRPLGILEPAQQHTQTALPWDDPLCYAKQQLHKLQTKGPAFLTEHSGNTEPFSGTVCTQLDLSDMQRCRQRSLFDWHYSEHHDANIFPQVLQSAAEEYLCVDTFRGSHNHTLYIFCHNPMSPHRQSKESWDVALHTDVKFRKYLEHVAGTVSDWTREEELKRDAMQIKNCNSVESPQVAEVDEMPVCAVEEDTVEPVIRKDSLKAWKLEQDREKEEQMAKKSKNPVKSRQQKEDDRPASNRNSKPLSGGRKSRPETAGSRANTPPESTLTTSAPEDGLKEPQSTEEPVNVFTGYSMDGQLVHVSGRLQHLFPSDGGQITVENINFVQGSSQMKVALKKDGHHFYTHINHVVNPVKLHQAPDKKCADTKDNPKEAVEVESIKQSSFTAVLDNGIHLSYSFYGPTGEYTVTSQEAEGGLVENSPVDPIPLSPSNSHCKTTDIQTHSSNSRPPESQVPEAQPASPSSSFRSLNVSVPNGLLLQFMLDDSQGVSPEEKGILVRQSFPLHGTGDLKHHRDPSLCKELSRVITGQGAVIRCMKDGSTEVLFADGSISSSQDSGPVWVPDSEVQEENCNDEAKDKKERDAGAGRGCWLTTTPSGDRICTAGTTHKRIPTTSLLTFKATDPITHQVMLSREDLVVSIQNPDGSLVVEHADGTRITSLVQDKPPNESLHHLLDTGMFVSPPGEQPQSATFQSASQCAGSDNGYVTRCMDSINDNMHIQPDTAEEIIRNSAGNPSDKEGSLHAYPKLSLSHNTGSNLCKNDEQSVCAEETVTENGKTSVCGSDGGSTSVNERVVLVEKEGCATVVMYPERHTAHVFFADGSVITGNNQGEYQVFPSNAGLLHIQSDGKCVYSSDQLVTPSPSGGTPTNQTGVYTMSHTEKVACDVMDLDGNHFQVMEDGQVCVLSLSPAPSTLKHDEEEQEDEEDREIRLRENHTTHCPRLFLVHEDGSGTELLSSHTVEELLYQAYSDPTVALLKEPVPDTQEEFGISILRPSHQSVWSQWVLDKQNPDITPPNLRNRSWHDFPRVEKKSPGPPFGTDIGRGLTLSVKSGGSATWRQSVKSCPEVLEIRELYQHRPFTSPLKNTIDSRLKEYIQNLMERERQHEEMKVKDPRPEEESTDAQDLLNLILSFSEDDSSHRSQKRRSEDIASLYSQGVGALTEQSDVSEDTTTSDSLETFKCFANGKDSKWTERLADHRQEIHEEKTFREAMKKKDIVPFFHPENLPLYQSLLQPQIPNMRSLSMNLPPFPKSDSAESFLKDAPQESTPRPLNPTPSQSASHTVTSSRTPEKRPTNPTPQSAGERSQNASGRQCNSLQVDVTGKSRKAKVRLPNCLLSSKPSSKPNQQFLTVEEPVRRKCQTISLTDPTAIVRGFHLLPSRVDFGTVQEGTSSAITVLMRNVGVDTCRFHVKQPPPASGLRVIYNPGPVAAGLQVELQVHLFAMCAAQVGESEPRKYISQDITIKTETEILYLPVTATILPERLYVIWLKDRTLTHKKKGSRVFLDSSMSVNPGQIIQSSSDQSHSEHRKFQ